MDEVSKVILYIALLIGLFIAVAYFAGLATDVNVFGAQLGNLVGMLQGRGSNGQLLAYPAGGPGNSTIQALR
jgi:hypothetical protein